MVAAGIITLILIFLIWILFTPLVIYLNTTENQYYIKLTGLVGASIISGEDTIMIRLRVPFYTFKFDPFKLNDKVEKKVKAPAKASVSKPKNRKSWSAMMRLAKSLIQTFEVKYFILNVDTDNYPLNAQLIPVFTFMSQGPVSLSTNFMGDAHLSLEIENRLIRLVKPAFKYLISK